jgi:hypothetical protein
MGHFACFFQLTSHSRWYNGYRACHYAQGSRVQTRPRAMDFKSEWNLQVDVCCASETYFQLGHLEQYIVCDSRILRPLLWHGWSAVTDGPSLTRYRLKDMSMFVELISFSGQERGGETDHQRSQTAHHQSSVYESNQSVSQNKSHVSFHKNWAVKW